MKRIVVIGSGGAGKSTFAIRLGSLTGIPVIHLDSIFWKPQWQPTPKQEWEAIVAEFLQGDSWIMDGNFGGTREMRIAACDTVIFLDIPRRVCLYRVLKRVVQYHGKSRPDMAEGCSERIDFEFLAWVWNYPHQSRSRLLSELEAAQEKDIVILKSKGEAEDFLQNIEGRFRL